MSLFSRVTDLFKTANTQETALAVADQQPVATYYTRGDEIYTGDEYRSLLELEWQNLLRGVSGVSDLSLTEIYKVTIPAFACIEYRAQMITEMPLAVTDVADREQKVHPFDYFLNSAPELLENVERSLNIWGSAYLKKVYNSRGYPSGLKWVNNNDIEDIVDSTGQIVGYWQHLPDHKRLELDEVIYIGLFDPDGSGSPLSPMEAAFTRANVDRNLAAYAAAFFFNSARPDGVLTFTQELSVEQLEYARDEWKKAFKGTSNAHRTAVMPAGAQWTAIQSPMKDLALGELDDRTTQKICAVFRVHPALVGLGDASDPLSAQSTLDAEQRQVVQRVVLPRANRICRALTNQWSKRDFVPKDHYVIKVDKQSIELLSDVNKDRAETSKSLTESGLYDFDEAREIMGASARDPEVDLWIKRHPQHPRDLFNDGLALWNESRKMMGLDPMPWGDFVLWGDDRVPKSKIRDYLNDPFDKPEPEPEPTPPPVIVGGQPALPSPEGVTEGSAGDNGDEPPVLPETVSEDDAQEMPVRMDFRASSTGEAGATLLLDLGYNDLIQALQSLIQAQMDDAPQVIRWLDRYRFHITLVHAPIIDTAQVRTVMSLLPSRLEPMAIEIGELATFEKPDQIVLYLSVVMNDRLRQFQQMLFDLCTEVGATVSELSQPENWTPHVTLAYAQAGTTVPRFDQPVTVVPGGLLITRGDYYEIGGIWMGDEPEVSNETEAMAISALSSRSTALRLSLGVNLAKHQFVRYARRELADLLGERTDVEWISDDDWRLDLVAADDWSPADAAKLMRGLDVTANAKLDAWTAGFAVVDDGIYLRLEDSEGVARFAESLVLESSAFGVDAESVAVPGVLLARAAGVNADDLNANAQRYPLILNNVGLFVGEQSQTTWGLRGVSKAQVKELKNWGIVVSKKGADYDFEVDALAGSAVAEFVRWGLQTQANHERVFDYADAMLCGRSAAVGFEDGQPMLTESIFDLLDALGLGTGDEFEVRTKASFKSGLRSVFRGYWNGTFSMFEMMDAGGSVIRRAYRQAWIEGAAREGISESELSPRELDELNHVINEELGNLLNVVNSLQGSTKADGGKLAPVLKRADNWVARYDRIAAKAELMAAGDKKKKWVVGPTEHCDDCRKLNGRIYRASKWDEMGIEPQSPDLQCFGVHCQCRLEDTDEPITRGRFPKLSGPRSGSEWDPHNHEHGDHRADDAQDDDSESESK